MISLVPTVFSTLHFADDMQLYLILNQSERSDAVSTLEKCISDVRSWSIRNNLMFNDSKTEVIHVSSKFKQSPPVPKISIGESTIDISSSAKSLGVIIDDTLQMKDHAKSVVRVVSFAIYKIGQLSRYLDRDSIERLVQAFVSSRLKSFNSLLYGLPDAEISKLQKVQNAAAKLVYSH